MHTTHFAVHPVLTVPDVPWRRSRPVRRHRRWFTTALTGAAPSDAAERLAYREIRDR